MAVVYCVRADSGKYSDHYLRGGYAAIGWFGGLDLSSVRTKDELTQLYGEYHPWKTNPLGIAQDVGSIARFLLEMKVGDFVLTPCADSRHILWGTVEGEYSYAGSEPSDGCSYSHRKRVAWRPQPVERHMLSIPLQSSLKATHTVFVVHPDPVLADVLSIRHREQPVVAHDPYEVVLNRLLELDATEFELLVKEVLASLGFDAEHVGKSGDEGVDATGLLDVYNLAKIKLFVQAKRYKRGSRIAGKVVRSLRQKIPHHAQGAFITTADFQKDAFEVAEESGFPRIGLMNGTQLVDLLAEQWDKLPAPLKEELGLRRGLLAG